MKQLWHAPALLLLLFFPAAHLAAQPRLIIDLAEYSPERQQMTRIHGSRGRGNLGVPLGPPADLDGDGLADFGVAYIRASPLGRTGAGEVNVIFGTGRLNETFDTAVDQPRLLRIFGDVNFEAAGNEIWLDDVTGDGVADLLVGRQNFSPSQEKIGAGALSIVVGGPSLRALAAASRPLDLRDPDPAVPVFTIVGRRALDRLGIWMRTGDVDGDGVADVVVGADQEDSEAGGPSLNQGVTYVIRGGVHLRETLSVSLDAVADTPLHGNLARLLPPAGGTRYHLGATCFIADLDGNGRGEVLTAAALSRAGAIIAPLGASGAAEGSGGAPRGELYIAWDELFPTGPWPEPFDLDLTALGASGTRIRGGQANGIFGEEIIGGPDFDGDGRPDLFVGDFEADESPGQNRPLSGTGYVFYAAERLRGLDFSLDELPEELMMTRILGPSSFAIGADTAAAGDFNQDGFADLAYGSPHHDPAGRDSAGSIHVLLGRAGGWPAVVSTAPGEIPTPDVTAVVEINGARGTDGGDRGDTLCYSAAAGDADGDGIDDLLTNEMVGNGLAPGTVDVGNLVVLAGPEIGRVNRLLFAQIGSGLGLVSQLVLTNPSPDLAVAGEIRITGEDGGPLPILAPQEGMRTAGLADTLPFTIAPLGSFRVETTAAGELLAGAAVVTSNGRLGGVVRFQIPALGITGVPAGESFTGFLAPIRSTPPRTGLAVFNPGGEDVILRLSITDNEGAPGPVGPVEIPLPAGGHVSLFVTQLFPGLDQIEFEGNLVVRVVNGAVAAVALDLGSRPGELVALPVTLLGGG